MPPDPNRIVELPTRLIHAPIITVEQHLLREQRRFAGVSGEFSWLVSGITLATKLIQAKVRRAGLSDILGAAGIINVQGEVQQKLDIYANEMMVHSLSARDSVAMLASEENEHPLLAHGGSPNAKYIVVFDPLDGSSNIDVCGSVGTTFSILRRASERLDSAVMADEVLQRGCKQVAAGYVVYGPSTMLVYSAGNGVHGFTLDPAVGAYVLSHPDIRMPEHGKYYSMNEAYLERSPGAYRRYVARLHRGELGRRYASRYIGSMIADFHRTLLIGGVFLYPPNDQHPQGKLRLLYEANPIAFIAEHAGGSASDGHRRILDIQPESIHQRTPLVVGGREEMKAFEAEMAADSAT
ncbi:MAG: class 1 fructose-bisphosphatase [Planctomycetia bacterium]|nr:class 1 fructose-bisphosphatase [Planctomycetia bacterium]